MKQSASKKQPASKNLKMPDNHLHYKGYVGSVVFSEQDAVFHGKIIGIKSLITFEGNSVAALVQDFHKAVDEYLLFCEYRDEEPERPYKGSFNVRIGADLHRRAAMLANRRGVSLNALVEAAVRKYVTESKR